MHIVENELLVGETECCVPGTLLVVQIHTLRVMPTLTDTSGHRYVSQLAFTLECLFVCVCDSRSAFDDRNVTEAKRGGDYIQLF